VAPPELFTTLTRNPGGSYTLRYGNGILKHFDSAGRIQQIFGIPQRTRALEAARAMTSIFTDKPNLTPYDKLTPGVALDEMNPPLKAIAGRQLQAARQSMAMNFKDIDDIPADIFNRVLWGDAMGWNTPYPKLPKSRRESDER